MADFNSAGDSFIARMRAGLNRVQDDIDRLFSLFRAQPVFRYAVVTAVGPVRIRYDGEDAPVAGSPDVIGHGYGVGDRVLCMRLYHRDWVLGAARAGDTGWSNIPLASGFEPHSGQTPQMRVIGGKLHLRGAVKPVSGSFTTAYSDFVAPGGIPDLPGIRSGWHSVRTVPSGGGSPAGRMFIQADGSMRVATTGGTATYYMLNSEYLIDY